jgi:hypothetical protein
MPMPALWQVPPEASRHPEVSLPKPTADRAVSPRRHSGGDPMHSGRGPRHARAAAGPRREAMALAGLHRRRPGAGHDRRARPVGQGARAVISHSPGVPGPAGRLVKATRRHPPPSRTQPVSSRRLGRDDAHPAVVVQLQGRRTAERPPVRRPARTTGPNKRQDRLIRPLSDEVGGIDQAHAKRLTCGRQIPGARQDGRRITCRWPTGSCCR